MSLDKFRGITSDQVDAVIDSLTDTEWDLLERAYLDQVSQLIVDYFTQPLGMDIEALDGTALFCRLYHLSLARTQGA